jgi:hypothetical protein
MSNAWAALACATAFWAIGVWAAYFEPARRPAGEAWVVTASDKIASRPMLIRAHVPFTVVRRSALAAT